MASKFGGYMGRPDHRNHTGISLDRPAASVVFGCQNHGKPHCCRSSDRNRISLFGRKLGDPITGHCKVHRWLEIRKEQIRFHDADDLWGIGTIECRQQLAGLGAILGWKNLKAITVTGNKPIPIHNRDKTWFVVLIFLPFITVIPLSLSVRLKTINRK